MNVPVFRTNHVTIIQSASRSCVPGHGRLFEAVLLSLFHDSYPLIFDFCDVVTMTSAYDENLLASAPKATKAQLQVGITYNNLNKMFE